MTEKDWAGVAAYLQSAWPARELSDETLAVWYDAVFDLEAQDVLTAARAVQRDGTEFCPTGGQLRQKVIEMASPPAEWSRGLSVASSCPLSWVYDPHAALAWVAERDPVAAKVVERWGTMQWGRGGTNESAERAQFRDMYQEVAQSGRTELAYAGLPAVSDPRAIGETARKLLEDGRE